MQPRTTLPAQGHLAGAKRALVVLSGALLIAGCGKKPGPRPDASSERIASAPRVSPDAVVEAPEPVTRTLGGVELAPLVDAGPQREVIIEAAMVLAENRKKGVSALVAAGPAAGRVVVALLASKSIDEILGALEVLATDGDPTRSREQAMEPVLALIGHEVALVRDRAWEMAPTIANGEALLALLDRIEPARKGAVVRLLEHWDSAKIRNTLATLTRGADAELAREAAFALTTPARPGSAEAEALTTELLSSPDKVSLGLTLVRRMPSPLSAGLAKTASQVIDKTLLSDELALVLAAIRATVVLPVEDRIPLLEQLGRDGREEVRRVVAETLALTESAPSASLARIIEVVDRLLEDDAGSVRIAAIRARSALSTGPEHAANASNLLGKKLGDGNRGVRLAAVVALCHPAYGEASRALLDAQILREEKPDRALILEAMAASGSRPLIEAVIAKLDGGVLVPVAHQALVAASGVDLPATQADWMGWLDKQHPRPEPEPKPAPSPIKPGAAP
jgi:hypothetical protein